MKIKIYAHFFFLAVLTSCSDNFSDTHDALVGTWVYEREVFRSITTFDDPDVNGTLFFNENETGIWDSNSAFLDEEQDFEWDLQENDTKLAITKKSTIINSGGDSQVLYNTRVYDIVREGDDMVTINYSYSIEPIVDTIPKYEEFENIILTRIN